MRIKSFRLQQLALDVDRAGYATEMLLEWQEDKGGEMPAVMLDRLTAGLFTDQTTVARVRHPSEDVIAALLKASSSVRVGRAWYRRSNSHGAPNSQNWIEIRQRNAMSSGAGHRLTNNGIACER